MLKKLILWYTIALVLFVTSCSSSESPIRKAYNEGINITPMPMELKQSADSFQLAKNTIFSLNDPDLEKVAVFFAAKIKNSTGYNLDVKSAQTENNYISLSIATDIPVNNEGYLLEVTNKGVDIKAKTAQGVFYGMQTFMQLLPAEIESPSLVNNIAWVAAGVSVKDEPRFPYRGQHLDVCRHFADVDYIKKQLDVLAMFKINKFHWHLTEDQGWRIEIKKYPKLTEIGSKRVEGDDSTYGPYFYTQDQVKEIVAYAKERFIDVIPEVELPGHGVAALAAYPEFSCTGGPFEVRNIWGVANDVYCAGNDSTFQFLTDVIEEVMPLFDSEYFHIGGDECPKIRWKNCPKCQARIKELGIKGDKNHSAEEKLQSYFVQRMEKVLLKHNKKMIGWDEILEGGLAPTATVMSWRGEEGGTAAANMGHDAIMTPGNWLYLDHYQGDSKLLPITIGGYTTVEETYGYEPIPEKISEDKKHHILGAQANVWAEYMYTENRMEHMAYPRVLALAELNWTPKEKKNYKDFERRLDNIRVRLDMHGINYHIPLPEDKNAPSCNFIAFLDSVTIELKATEPVRMVYTTDGSEPTQTSAMYEKALTFNKNAVIKVRTLLISNKMSDTRTITIEKQTFAPAIEKPSDAKPGLKADYYKGLARKVSELEGRTPDETEYIESPQKSKYKILNYSEFTPDKFCSSILTGYINIPENGVYFFSSDSEVWIDGKRIIDNESETATARRFSRSDKSIALAKGPHSIKIVRLGAIFGGWPTQWDSVYLDMRTNDSKDFETLDSSYFN